MCKGMYISMDTGSGTITGIGTGKVHGMGTGKGQDMGTGMSNNISKYDAIIEMWREWHVASVSDIDIRLHNFRLLFAYNSGKIENEEITYHDTREIFENGRAAGSRGILALCSRCAIKNYVMNS